MKISHSKNTVFYYLFLAVFLLFLFFTNDFGLIDVQKTAIVMAVGIDREEDSFLITSQIAIPQSSKQGKSSQSVQIVSRGKTVADAFEEINAKTGWYPKLVFCKLLLLGKSATAENVFDALDFFLRDEYLSDNCLVAACESSAKDMLNVTALVDQSGSLAMDKILSPHAERVGSVLTATLREFSIGYFSDSHSGFLPIITTVEQQEPFSAAAAQTSENEEQSSTENSGSEKEKQVFSASETALFVEGKWVGKLTKEESFAVSAVQNKLRLAAYSVPANDEYCTLSIRRNTPKTKLLLGEKDRAVFKITVDITAGISDYSAAQDLNAIKDVGDVPKGVFTAAERKLASEIQRAFEKCRGCGCDLFGLQQRLQKYAPKRAPALQNTLLESALVEVSVSFKNVR